MEGDDLHFGGCQFTFWRLKLSWGCFIEKGGNPKRLVLWVPVSRESPKKGPKKKGRTSPNGETRPFENPPSSERKRHINSFHINFLCRPSSPGLSQVFTGFVPGTNPVKSPGQTRGRPKTNRPKKFMFMCLFLARPSFNSHALCILSADNFRRFLENSREFAQIVGGQNVQSMRVKRSDLQKD